MYISICVVIRDIVCVRVCVYVCICVWSLPVSGENVDIISLIGPQNKFNTCFLTKAFQDGSDPEFLPSILKKERKKKIISHAPQLLHVQ